MPFSSLELDFIRLSTNDLLSLFGEFPPSHDKSLKLLASDDKNVTLISFEYAQEQRKYVSYSAISN